MTGPHPWEFYESDYHFLEDAERPNFPRLWRALRRLEPLAGTTFLDLGSGVGWAARLALRRGGARRAVALDFARRPLDLGRRQTPEAHWVRGDGTTLPFATAAFDRVLAFGSLEHFPDLGAGLAELRRILRPGGLAAIVVPNFYVRTEQPREFRASGRAWERIFREAGFEIEGVGTDSGPAILKNRRPTRILIRLALRVASLIPPLRYQFVFVLRRP
ncbi:MAG TPA: class I SAM-dependent methyltransferase [Gemmatimonadales bacterium]|nr:class I SAM-dependent methyltransferase [Gemmatimonadales bacterium]